MNEKQKITRKTEVIRFIICGAICALADFLVSLLVNRLLREHVDSNLLTFLEVFSGFTVGVILNYLISTFWVFTGVEDTRKTKTFWFILLFVILSAGALGLSVGTTLLFREIFLHTTHLDINNVFEEGKSVFTFYFLGKAEFWLFGVTFGLRTIVGLIWNYFTRKYILYKNKNK